MVLLQTEVGDWGCKLVGGVFADRGMRSWESQRCRNIMEMHTSASQLSGGTGRRIRRWEFLFSRVGFRVSRDSRRPCLKDNSTNSRSEN